MKRLDFSYHFHIVVPTIEKLHHPFTAVDRLEKTMMPTSSILPAATVPRARCIESSDISLGTVDSQVVKDKCGILAA